MAVYRGGKLRRNAPLRPDEIDALFDSSRAASPVYPPMVGLTGYLGPDQSSLSIDYETLNQNYARDTFLGMIVDRGPIPEGGTPDDAPEDHEGSFYWVKEVGPYLNVEEPGGDVGIDERWEWKLREDMIPGAPPRTGRGEGPTQIVGKHVTAMNVAEYDMDDAEAESHALVFGDQKIVVRVFTIYTADDKPRHYFWRGAALIRPVVVRDTFGGYEGDAEIVGVQAIGYDEEEPPQMIFVGDIIEVGTWYNLRSRHYEPMRQEIINTENPALDPITMVGTHILPAVATQHGWKVWQFMRESFLPLRDEDLLWPQSDCTPIRQYQQTEPGTP